MTFVRYFWQMNRRDLFLMLGLPDKLPATYQRTIDYLGLIISVYPSRKRPGIHHNSAHRVFAHCPKCQRQIPVGRIAQHNAYAHGLTSHKRIS